MAITVLSSSCTSSPRDYSTALRQISRAVTAVLRRQFGGKWGDIALVWQHLHHPPPPGIHTCQPSSPTYPVFLLVFFAGFWDGGSSWLLFRQFFPHLPRPDSCSPMFSKAGISRTLWHLTAPPPSPNALLLRGFSRERCAKRTP